MAIEPYMVFFGVKDAGNMQPAKWNEKELIGVEGDEKNNGLKTFPSPGLGILKTPEVQQAYFVTVEAESTIKASAAVITFYQRGLAKPSVAGTPTALAVPLQGTGGGGFMGVKTLAVLASSVAEPLGYPA